MKEPSADYRGFTFFFIYLTLAQLQFMIKTICYVSDSKIKESKVKLDKMFNDIKTKNIINNISGVLIYKNGNFLQIIEGDKEIIDTLFLNIKKDKRHSHIITLIDFPIPHRLFKEYKTSFSIIDSP